MASNASSDSTSVSTETTTSEKVGETFENKEKETQGEKVEEIEMSKQKLIPRPNIQGYTSSEDEEHLRSASGSLPSSSRGTIPTYREQYRVYHWRWFMLITLCLLNVSNGTMWLTFAPIPNFTAEYYNITVNDVDWFSIIFFIVSLVAGLFSIFVLDTWGLKVSVYLGASFNLAGAIIRWLSTVDPILCSSAYDRSGFLVAMTGQFLTACGQPFLLYAPTKLAATWFGPNQRAICTNFASIANPIGIAVAQLVSPYVVTSSNKLPTLLWIYIIPAAVAFAMAAVAFWWNLPPIPPTPSAGQEAEPFLRGVKNTLINCSFWVLMVMWAGGAGMFNALLTLLPQILCPYGYSDKDAGLWGALMIFCGLAGATLAGLIIDYTKWFKDVAVITLAFALLCFIWFMEVSRLHDQPVNIAFSLCLFGFFALPLIPASMELGVEITYPVAEATSSGLLWSGAQITGIILVLIGQALQFDLAPDLVPRSHCNMHISDSSGPGCFRNSTTSDFSSNTYPQDFGHAMLFYVGFVFVIFVFFAAAFHPRYRRVEAEKEADFETSMHPKKAGGKRSKR